MAVIKRKRKESQFEVFHHFYKMRREITDLLLRDFGYSTRKSEKHLEKMFAGRPYEELNDDEKIRYKSRRSRDEAFQEWFILDQRKAIMDCLRNIQENVAMANSIYPYYMEELIERRLFQDRAIGQCNRLIQELQYAMETLPVDINKYLRFSDSIQREINLLKGWRKSDNKFVKKFEKEN